VTQLEFVRMLAEAAGRDAAVVHVPRDLLRKAGGQLTHPPLYFGAYLDLPPLTVRTERLRTELGFEPRPLSAGLRETFEWYSKQRRPRPDFAWEDRVVASARTARA
jgi:nucleoside-diphosphate-sugar epimerase